MILTSTPSSDRPDAGSDPVSGFGLEYQATTVDLDLQTQSNQFKNSKHSPTGEPGEHPSNALLQQVKQLHINTPGSPLIVNDDDIHSHTMHSHTMSISPERQSGRNHATMLTPPSTPKSTGLDRGSGYPLRAISIGGMRRRSSTDSSVSSTCSMDINTIDLDTTHAQLLGSGLWSKVYRMTPFLPAMAQSSNSSLYTPPSTPQSSSTFGNKVFSQPKAFAVKVATRNDALAVFESEAKILQHLQSSSSFENYIVPFYGFSPKNSALIFECCTAGTLSDIISKPRSSPSETLSLFQSLAPQLISALAFIHDQNVIHADIKPDNILLSPHPSNPEGLLARLADFSASFIFFPSTSSSSDRPQGNQHAGTYAYMAPELLSRDPVASTPTTASDVYSLGITLFSLLIGGDPFIEVGDNGFMLREAVKMGDVVGFARRQPGYVRRIEGAEAAWRGLGEDEVVQAERGGGMGGLLEVVNVAVKKARGARVGAREWVQLVERMGVAEV